MIRAHEMTRRIAAHWVAVRPTPPASSAAFCTTTDPSSNASASPSSPLEPRAGRDRAVAPKARYDRAAVGDHGSGVDDHGKNTRALGAVVPELAGRTTTHEILMTAYRELTAANITTRFAARLTVVARATVTRKPRTQLPVPAAKVVPANRFTDFERARILRVVNSPDFVNLPPLQIYARLWERGITLLPR